jgi:hypothetical protein
VSAELPSDPPSTPSPASVTTAELPPKDKYAHRKTIPGRAGTQCAADHPHFRGKNSLVYNFLEVISSEQNEDGERTVTKLGCAHCPGVVNGIWTLSADWDGSTGNFVKHFTKNHKTWWTSVVELDQKHLPERRAAPGAPKQSTIEAAFHNVSLRFPSYMYRP